MASDHPRQVKEPPNFLGKLEDKQQNRVVDVEVANVVHPPSTIALPPNTNNQLSTANRIILETIISCLQNCLRQKDETLEEYRAMIEEMRTNHGKQIANLVSNPASNLKSDTSPKLQPTQQKVRFLDQTSLAQQQQQEDEGKQSDFIESAYNDLFVKPCVEENEELIRLLKNAFNQLKM